MPARLAGLADERPLLEMRFSGEGGALPVGVGHEPSSRLKPSEPSSLGPMA